MPRMNTSQRGRSEIKDQDSILIENRQEALER